FTEIIAYITQGYTVLLSVLSFISHPRASVTRNPNGHLVLLLSSSFVVFLCRDIWPLCKFGGVSQDILADKLTSRLAILTVAGVIIPLFIPRPYAPLDPQQPAEPIPEQTSSLFSLAFFTFLNPFVYSSSKVLPPLADYDQAGVLVARSFPSVSPQSNPYKEHLFWRLMDVFYKEYTMMTLMVIVRAGASFISPLGVNRLLNYLETDGEGTTVKPWFWIATLFLGPVISSSALQTYNHIGTRMQVQLEGILTHLILQHALRIRIQEEPSDSKASEKSDTTPSNLVGKILNLQSSDLKSIMGGIDFVYAFLHGPLHLIVCICFLYAVLGWSSLIGLTVMFFSGPFAAQLAQDANNVQNERMKMSDARVKTVTETLSVIRMIKMFAWEPKMKAQIAEKRDEELGCMARWYRAALMILGFKLPRHLQTLVMKQELTASRVFSAIAGFELLRVQLQSGGALAGGCIQARVSLDRLNDFLNNTEVVDGLTDKSQPPAEFAVHQTKNAIGFHDASFSWHRSCALIPSTEHFDLRIDGDLLFQRGRLNLVTGQTGSGKTSLLMALLGEMRFYALNSESWFSLPRRGGVAYAAQESWIQSASIKENIVFDLPFDAMRYKQVLHQCALEHDLATLPNGDATMVGDKGVILSGGQKARVSLARAMYSTAEVVLLDDVLSALDIRTAQWVVQKCLLGDLAKGRTFIIVANNVEMLRPFSHFIVSLRGGRVVSREVNDVVRPTTESPSPLSYPDPDSAFKLKGSKEARQVENGKTEAAQITGGRIPWPALKLYLLSHGGFWFWSTLLGGILCSDALVVAQTYFLAFWASAYDQGVVPASRYIALYVLIVLAGIAAYASTFYFFTRGSLRASQRIHARLADSVMGTTLRWLETVPQGQVITRFTHDLHVMDSSMAFLLENLIEMTLALMLKFGTLVFINPSFVIPAGLCVALAGAWIGQVFIASQRPVKQAMNDARSPLTSHLAAAMGGLVSIRAYGAQDAFKAQSLQLIDKYSRPARVFYLLNRWIEIRMDLLSGTFAAALAAYLVYGVHATSSNIGFSLNMAMSASGMILGWIKLFNDFQVQGTSLERIHEYINIEQESKGSVTRDPPAYWPSSGSLVVEGLSARYSAEGPDVLQNISFEVRSGERIGVVGRTGCGKSSLALALLRMMPTAGRVQFDSLDTNGLDLDAVRSNITIIPQQPELLSGTLRQNLDPFSEHGDAVLMEALHVSGLFSLHIEDGKSRMDLDSRISGGGGNLSLGQRQIIALARAVVRQSKTDSLIQTSIRERLEGTTVITIAHRLRTVMDADRVLVLDGGNVVEYDTPHALLLRDQGLFKSMVEASNERLQLYEMALK
ncbi:hypothetical protein BOTBODRAFT_100859, partial [Botryobasidium botryosum FD-172 SS1]